MAGTQALNAPARPSLARRHLIIATVIAGASVAYAHEPTRAAHDAAVDPRETRALLAAASLRAAGTAARAEQTCQLTIRLIDTATREPLDGLVRVTRSDGSVVPLPELVNRGIRLRANHPAKDWFAVTESATVRVPRASLKIEAFAGLHTELASFKLDVSQYPVAQCELPLAAFYRASQNGWYAGNTHLHLNTLTRAQADDYLRTLPRADGLDIVFVSHLERAKADETYITNGYSRAELERLGSGRLQFGNGEEHRHNFERNTEGYGHVLFLDIQQLVRPVSIGPVIAGAGPDWPPLRTGIDAARRDDATIIWCHNRFGYEDVPAWVAGVIGAQNIFDGGSQGSYADTFYRYLDIGLKVPFSTGTDWFIYDFSRVYARLEGMPTVKKWLSALAAGRSFITNGPWLELRIDSHEVGDTIRLRQASRLKVQASARGRHDFSMLELVHDGTVVHSVPARRVGAHFEAAFDFSLPIDSPGWAALRIAGGSLDSTGAVAMPPALPVRGAGPKNEMGEALFAHTSPIYFEMNGRRVFRRSAAEALIADMEGALRAIPAKARFNDEAQRDAVLQVYRDGIRVLRQRLND